MIHHIVVTTMMVVFSYMGIRMFRRAVASQELQVNSHSPRVPTDLYLGERYIAGPLTLHSLPPTFPVAARSPRMFAGMDVKGLRWRVRLAEYALAHHRGRRLSSKENGDLSCGHKVMASPRGRTWGA